MSKKNFVNLVVSLSDLPRNAQGRIDTSQNVRGDDDTQVFEYEYGNLQLLGESMLPISSDGLLEGMHTPVVLNRRDIDGKKTITEIIDGNRRILAAEIIGAKALKAIAYDDLTDAEIANMRAEHSTQKSISRIGVYRIIKQAMALGKPGIEIVNTPAVLNALQTLHPVQKNPQGDYVNRKGEKIIVPESSTMTRNNWFERFRGVFQAYERVYRNGILAEQAWTRRQAGLQNWPSDAEMKTLSEIFVSEQKANPTTVSPTNPGPQWRAKWDQMQIALEEAEKEGNGGNKPKSVAVMTAKELEGENALRNSLLLKCQLAFVRRDPTAPDAVKMTALDELAKTLDADVLKIIGAKPEADKPEADKPEADKPEAAKADDNYVPRSGGRRQRQTA